MPIAERTRLGAEQVAELVRSGMSISKASAQVGEQHGVTARTARFWVQRAGIKLDTQHQPNFQDFNEQRRARAGNQLAEVLEGRIKQLHRQIQEGEQVPSREIRELTVAFGVLTDKRRLEDGDVTDRTEQTTVPAREIIEAKIEDLAERRKQRNLRIVDDD